MLGRKMPCLVLLLAVGISVCGAEEPNSWEKLNLKSTQIAATRVFYEECFEQSLPVFEKAYKRFRAAKRSSRAALADKDKIIADINRILGGTRADTKMQSEMLGYYLSLFWETDFTFYLVRKATIKDFLRAGGRLVNFFYDRESDIVQYRLEFKTTGKSEPVKELEIPLVIGSQANFEQDVSDGFEAIKNMIYGSRSLGTAIHEVTELNLLKRARPKDQYWRWFTDGFANAVTIELLQKHLGKEAAEQFAEPYNAMAYIDLLRQSNLAYWMSTTYNIEAPLQYEKQLDYARYCFATLEAQRLIKEHGIECVRNILDVVVMKNLRTSQGLFEAIRKTTGENMKQRLMRYQTFETTRKGALKYMVAFKKTQAAKDYEQMLISHLRLVEVMQESPYSLESLKNYQKAALLLVKLDRDDAADSVMDKCLELFRKSHVPNVYRAALEQHVIYALGSEQPAKGEDAANELLRNDPDNVPSLSVKALLLAHSGKLIEAREIAARIKNLVPDNLSKASKVASEILAIDPNQQ